MYYNRILEEQVKTGLKHNPVTAIIGPRQCGKSTLAKHIIDQSGRETLYLDLERPGDLQKLENAEWFLSKMKGKLICLDEIQRKPELFPLIRSLVDEWQGNGHFLILGSANRDLIKQSSETLAGRITYKELTPFLYAEIKEDFSLEEYLVKGGFPRSLLQKNHQVSLQWRQDFIITFLERDLLQWRGFSTETMRRLWQMTAHVNGQTANYSLLASALGVSSATIKTYIDLLSSTFMIKLLPPYLANMKKRMVKAPKIYLNDTGIVNALLGIGNFEVLAGHPSIGPTWETLVLTNLQGHFPQAAYYFFRTSHGAELDIIMKYNGKTVALECKTGTTPSLSKGNHRVIHDLNPVKTFIVAPVKTGWPAKPGIEVTNPEELIVQLKQIFL